MSVLVYASNRATRQATDLLPGRCLENVVEQAICSGKKTRHPYGGLPALDPDGRYVSLIDGRLVAVLSKRTSHLTHRKAWNIDRLVELKPRKEAA